MGRAVGAFDLSADGRYLAVTANPTGTSAPQNSASFQRIDLTTGTIETFTFVTSKVDLTSLIVSDFMDIVQLPGNRIMATTQQLGGGIIIIDLNGASPTITKIAASSASGYLDASADHTRVVVSGGGVHHYLDGVGIIGSDINDPYAGAAVPPDPIPFREAALSPLADLIMVAGRPYNTSLTLQPAIEAQLRFGSKVTAFNADGTRLYGVVDNLLAVYDTASWQVIAVYPLDAVAAANRGGSALGGYTYSGFGDTIEVSSDGRYVSLISTAGVILLDLNLVVSIATPQSDNQLGLRTQIGLDGDDQLGGVDALQLYGGLGDDTYTVFQNFSRITEYANEGTDTVLVGVSNYALTENVEIGTVTLTGGAWVGGNELDNVLNGNIGGDWLAGAAGADTILGNGGIDRIDGGEGNDTLDGGEGSDTVSGDAGADAIAGGEGDDLLASATLSSSIYTTSDDLGSEIDIISGGAGNDGVWIGYGDSADGGADTDTLYLSLFASPSGLALTTASLLGSAPLTLGGGTILNFEVLGGLRGTEQGDTITVSGMAGPATINSGGGDDVVYATDTAVNLDGGSGNDHFYSGSAADNFAGNIGTNTLDYSLFGAGVTVTYQFDRSGIGPGGDTFSNVQIVSGSNFNDLLTGGQQADQLEGHGSRYAIRR
jgi:Ca2+-binding RTX toxin-like protein